MVIGHYLLGLLGPVLFFIIILTVDVLFQYLHIVVIFPLLLLPVLNLEADLVLVHIVV